MKKSLVWTLCVGVLLAYGSVVNAMPITWNFSGVTFTDSTTATGSYDYDADTDTYSNWNISTTLGALSGFTYNTSTSYLYSGNSSYFLFLDNNYLANAGDYTYIQVGLLGPMTNAGGTISMIGYDETYVFPAYTGVVQRYITPGAAVTAETPEPATLALLGLGLFGVGFSRRKGLK